MHHPCYILISSGWVGHCHIIGPGGRYQVGCLSLVAMLPDPSTTTTASTLALAIGNPSLKEPLDLIEVTHSLWACSSALNRIRWRAIFLHRAFQRLHRNRLTLHQPPLVEENLNRSPSRLGPVDGSCGAANTNFCKQLLGYSRVSAAEELRGRGC